MESTTFIFGAGVSIPFELPSGEQLLKLIVAQKKWFPLKQKVSISQSYIEMLHLCDQKPGSSHTKQFYHSIARSPTGSIDQFLNDNPKFEEIGKIAIAYEILRLEHEHHSCVSDIWWKKNDQNVFRHIWNSLPGKDRFEELSKHRFITFNYDRMFEHFVFDALVHGLGKDPDDAIQKIKGLDIIHVYGSLGEYSQFCFGQKFNIDSKSLIVRNADAVKKASQSIKLMKDARADIEVEKRMSEALNSHGRVIFLGFGYDDTNCKLLKRCYHDGYAATDKGRLDLHANNYWHGSVMDKLSAEVSRIQSLLNLREDHIGDKSSNDVMFMRAKINVYT